MSSATGAVAEPKKILDFGLNDNIGCYNLCSSYKSAHSTLLSKLNLIINQVHV